MIRTTITTTTTTTQRRRASSSKLQKSTAVILFMLSLGMQYAVSAFSSSSIISRRGILNYASSSSHRGVGVVQQSMISTTNRRRIPLPSSRLYTATTTTTLQTATDNSVVELQYSEFLPPKRNGDDNNDNSSITHPPVIFLHGLLGNKRNFASLASSLSSQLDIPRPIYTIDLRNHGENTHDWRSSMSYSEMARDVLAFMDKISDNSSEAASATNGGKKEQQQKAVLVGHSMGGKVAQSLALMYPERVAGLVVLDIAPVRYYSDQSSSGGGGGGGDDGSGWKAVEEIVRSVASIDLADEQFTTKRDVDAVLRNGMLEDAALRAFVLTNLEQLRIDDVVNDVPPLRWKIHWDGIVNELDRIAGFDVHDEIMDDSVLTVNGNEGDEERMNNAQGNNIQYEGDVFFIHGGASRFVRHSFLPTIASYFPNHMLTTIRGVGHWVHAEAPDDTIALLKQYLDR